MRINNSKWNNNGKEEKKAIDLPKQVSEESKTNKREEQKKQQQKQQQQWHTQQSTINSSALKLSFFHWRIYIPTHLLEMYNKRIAIRSYVHLIQCCAVGNAFAVSVWCVCVGDGGIAAADTELKFFSGKEGLRKKTAHKIRWEKKKSTFAFIHVSAVGAQIRNHQMNSSTKEAKEKENKTK